ncbi:hypothetical protein DPMN_077796 [Dreissena polymorpha]|uniref:Uncharacterized protein n=1 Tax=Dreissena polymorpha TaxID=45954 RepID=A0A9D4BNM3_DREPO|nr:hypothetical protein DPMN_077796 [Dreissena polymorpha]
MCNERGITITARRYRWRHDIVLREVADYLEQGRTKRRSSTPRKQMISCVKPGETAQIQPKQKAPNLNVATVGVRGFCAKAVCRLMSAVGYTGRDRRRTIQNLNQAAERSSSWLWLRRDDAGWKKKCYRHSHRSYGGPTLPRCPWFRGETLTTYGKRSWCGNPHHVSEWSHSYRLIVP